MWCKIYNETQLVNVRGFKCQQVGGKISVQGWQVITCSLWLGSYRVISLSAFSNVKDMSRLTEKQEHWCLQSDLHTWTYRTDGCMGREKGWMNEWRRGTVIQNQWEKYVTINTASGFTAGLIKARCQNVFLIEYSAIKMSSISNQMDTYDLQALRTYWECLDSVYICAVNQNLSGLVIYLTQFFIFSIETFWNVSFIFRYYIYIFIHQTNLVGF